MSHRLDISVFSNPLFEIGSVVLVLWKNETGWPIEMVTKNIEPLTGYDSNDFLQKKLAYIDLMHPHEIERVVGELAQIDDIGYIKHAPYRLKHVNGRYIWVQDYTVAVRDERGQITHYVGYLIDVTERMEAEEALTVLNRELLDRVKAEVEKNREKDFVLSRQARFAVMGEMISNIAHQWRQPLSALAVAIQDARVAFKYGEADEKYMDYFEETTMRLIKYMSGTIDDFRNFFRPNKEKTTFFVLDSATQAKALVKDTLTSLGIKLNININEDISVIGYPGEFSQVILNLIANAKDAFASSDTDNRHIDITAYNSDSFAEITVKDNAGGIDEHIFERIFEPYFTTKHQAQGTGLGLYKAKMIIEQSMGGSIWVKNIDGGAQFTIRIPYEAVA